jgi:hypothetical protein
MARIEDRAELVRLLAPGERIVATIPGRPMGAQPPPQRARLSWLGPVVAGALVGVNQGMGSPFGPLGVGLACGVGVTVAMMVGHRSTPSRPNVAEPVRAYQLAVSDRNLFIGSLTRMGAAEVTFRPVPLDAITSIDVVDKKTMGIVNGHVLTLTIADDPSPFVAFLLMDNSRKVSRKERFLQALRSPADLG